MRFEQDSCALHQETQCWGKDKFELEQRWGIYNITCGECVIIKVVRVKRKAQL